MEYEVGTVGVYPIQNHGFTHNEDLTRVDALGRIQAVAPTAAVGVRRQTAGELLQMSPEECQTWTLNRVFVVIAVGGGFAYAVYFKDGNWSLVSKTLDCR